MLPWRKTVLLALFCIPTITYAGDSGEASRTAATEALIRAGIPGAEVQAQDAWEKCTDDVIDRFAKQHEPARDVAQAAIAACLQEEIQYAQQAIHDPIMKRVGATLAGMQDAMEKAVMPQLLARIMAVRAIQASQR